MIFRTIRRIALLSALLILAGCYETDFAVIGTGVEVPGLAGTFRVGDKGSMMIEDRGGAPGTEGHEYLLRLPTGEEFELRAESVRDQLWLAQLGRVDDDGAMRYLFLYLGKDGDNFVFKLPDLVEDSGTPERLAAEYGVEILKEADPGKSEFRIKLNGTREAIHAFLRAHPGRVALGDGPPLVAR